MFGQEFIKSLGFRITIADTAELELLALADNTDHVVGSHTGIFPDAIPFEDAE